MSLPGACTQIKQADCPAQAKQAAEPAAQEKQADCPAQVKQAAEPAAQEKQAAEPAAQAKQAVETAQVKQAVTTEISDQSQTPSPGLPAKQEEYNPSIAAVLYADQGKIHSLENKVNHFSNALSEQGAAANLTAAELSLQCDRISFDLEQSQQSQTTALQACMHKMQGTMDAQGQATGQLQTSMEGLFIMLSDMQQSFQSSNVLPTAAAAAPAAAAITESPPLMREETFEENPEATEALLLAQSFLLSGTESIDQKIFAQFNIATVDQATYSRHTGKYADIRSFTESVCKDDPSIEADLTDALLQQGTVKTAALQNLREKLGAQNHRTQILGDLMLLYLLMRPSTDSAIKESMNATCRDFILQGHSELTLFIKRCQTGQSLLLRNVTARERDAAIARGLSAVQHPQSCTALIYGAIIKLGYSSKPACDLKALLDKFEDLKQETGEDAHIYINKFNDHVSAMERATELMNKPGSMPNDHQLLTQLKKGTRTSLRAKAVHVLQYMQCIPLSDVTFEDMCAALQKADKLMAEYTDEESSLKSKLPPRVPAADTSTPSEPEKKIITQDPMLTLDLKAKNICCNNVAFTLGKGKYPCKKGPKDCLHQHLMPTDVGLSNENYSQFVVHGEHLKILPGTVLYDGKLPPSAADITRQVATPALNADQKEEEDAKPAVPVATPCLGAPLIDRNCIRSMNPPFYGRQAI